MRVQKIVSIVMISLLATFAMAQTNPNDGKPKDDASSKTVASANKGKNDVLTASVLEGNDNCNKFYGQLPSVTKKDSEFIENSEDEFGEDIDDDFEVPASDIYGLSWTSESLNPYKIKIDDLPDSTWVDCSGFVFPVVRNCSNKVTSNFGARRHRYHYGTDIGLRVGDTIVSAFDGTVRIVSYEARGFGHYIVVRHNNGLESLYAHLSKPLVKVNQKVRAGELIGLGGNTGRSTGPHLHLEFRFLGNAFNTNKIIDYASESCYADNYCITKNETFRHKADMDKLKQSRYHKVRQGETLSHIAKRYGTTVNNLCKLNHISRTTIIRPGRAIRYR